MKETVILIILTMKFTLQYLVDSAMVESENDVAVQGGSVANGMVLKVH